MTLSNRVINSRAVDYTLGRPLGPNCPPDVTDGHEILFRNCSNTKVPNAEQIWLAVFSATLVGT